MSTDNYHIDENLKFCGTGSNVVPIYKPKYKGLVLYVRDDSNSPFSINMWCSGKLTTLVRTVISSNVYFLRIMERMEY